MPDQMNAATLIPRPTSPSPKAELLHPTGIPLVRDLMTPQVVTCQRSDPCLNAVELMRKHDIGILPVLDGTRLVGVITDRDLALRHISSVGSAPGKHRVENCMTPRVFAVNPDCSVDDAMRSMRDYSVRRLLVTDGNTLKGILTLDDILLRAGRTEAVGKVIDEVLVQSTLRHWA